MVPEQVPVLLRFLFNRTRATNANPRPTLRWVGEDQQTIRDELRGDGGIQLDGVVNDEVCNSIEDLTKLLNHFLDKQPKLTRGFSQQIRLMETWLSAGGQRGKMQRISAAYPNNLGQDGEIDNLTSFTDFLTTVRAACLAVSQRLSEGLQWFDQYNQMTHSLSRVRSLLPKVQLELGEKSELVSESKTLVTCREKFWTLFETWIKRRVNDYVNQGNDGLEIVRTLLPETQEIHNQTFVNIRQTVRTECNLTVWCYVTTQLINPESIPTLQDIWRDINVILSKVSALKVSVSDKHSAGVNVLTEDIREILSAISVQRSVLDQGARQSYIFELDNLMNRLNVFRSDGLTIDPSFRKELFDTKSMLMDDKAKAETEARVEENKRKLESQAASSAAPKLVLMKLRGYDTWVSWLLCLTEITKFITSDQVRCQIVMDSLVVPEDRKFLTGVTSFAQQIKFLKSKYHRPREMCSSILARGTSMIKAGDNKKQSKENILTILSVKRDLTKLGYVSRLDTFYLNLIAVKIFTNTEYELFLRAAHRHQEKISSAQRDKTKLAMAVTSSKVADGGPDPGDDDEVDPWTALDRAGRDRDLSDGESDDDDSTSVFSLCTRAREGVNEGQDVKSYRKFFFSYLNDTLALMRTIESMNFASGNSKEKSTTQSNNTETNPTSAKCLMKGCNKTHQFARSKKPTQSLAFCDAFKKLDIKQRKAKQKELSACVRCLQPGHELKTCKLDNLKCRLCDSPSHATLLCFKSSGDNKADTKKDNGKKSAGTSSHQTVTDKDEPAVPEVTPPPAETVSNLGLTTPGTYDLLESEAYLLSRDGNQNPVFTCVGEICSVDSAGREHAVGALFDHCSSDSWVSAAHARKVKAKRLNDWVGQLRTIEGVKPVKLPAVEIRVFNHETGQTVKIEALVTKEIGSKPTIDEPRFTRLCSAFGVKTHQVDQFAGPCEILIGVKAQSLQISKVAKFRSQRYPNVGLYSSPLLNKLIFVGSDNPESQRSISYCTTTTVFRCETQGKSEDLKFDQFLQSEKTLALSDILCDSCEMAAKDCPTCRAARSDSTLVELSEDASIKEALQLERVSGSDKSLKQQFMIEYPTHSNLDQIYTEENCNQKMAMESSKALRKKLIKSEKIHEFHAKVMDSVEKGHTAVMTDKMKQQYEGLPKSYQLINFVVKESSASTKLRVVTNSSVPRKGGSFNEQCLKGSSMIASAPEILFGFSAHCHALMTDLKEAYRSTKTGPVTNSCRRFYWFTDIDDPESLAEFILLVSTYGDRPAGNILAQALHTIANDPRVSELVKNFIANHFFVDDGLISSASKETLLELAENLPTAFANFSFQIKHIILSFVKSNGVTLSENLERFFGIIWNFDTDQFTPALEVWLSRKQRGVHLGSQLSGDMVHNTVFTRRVLLRVVGSLHDIGGRFLGILQIKARLVYARICQQTKGLGWDAAIVNPDLVKLIQQLLWDIIEVKSELKPFDRAWIKEGFELDMIVGPYDGSIEAYGALLYCRSYNAQTDEYDCCLASSRSKCSELDCGDNELSSSLLNAKQAEVLVRSIPEKPKPLRMVLITDSQCTAHCHSDKFNHTVRRRRNVAVRFARSLRRLHCENNNIEILLVWMRGETNPSDLCSKMHENVAQGLNSNFWRKGHKSYLMPEFPSVPECVVYARLSDEKFTYYGLPSSSAHLTTCNFCSVNVDHGKSIANQLISQNQLLCFKTQTAEDKLADEAMNVSREPTDSRDQFLSSFNSVHTLVRVAAVVSKWQASALGRSEQVSSDDGAGYRYLGWAKIICHSQKLYKPEHIKQCLPVMVQYRNVSFVATKNRLTPAGLTRYHGVPFGALPIVSSKDRALVNLLISSAHVVRNNSPADFFHLNKLQTIVEVRKHFAGVHVNGLAKLVQKFINQCVYCRKMEAALQPLQISDKWILRHSEGGREGLFSSVGMDIMGSYRFKLGSKTTRSTKLGKAWVLWITCQISSACNAVIMEDYSVSAFMTAFETHVAQHRRPVRITSDAGSQFRSIATRTRAAQKLTNESSEADAGGMDTASLFQEVAKKMKNIQFFVAPSSAQWSNGLAEGNFRAGKTMMKKLTTGFQQSSFVFKSGFELNNLFQKICGVLNDRPIFFGANSDYYISAKSITCPGTVQSDFDDTMDQTSKSWSMFLQEFESSVVTGDYTKFGKTSTTKRHELLPGDFVLVVYETQNVRRYGIIKEVNSHHTVTVKVLHKRSVGKNEQNYVPKTEQFSAQQIKLIYRVPSK